MKIYFKIIFLIFLIFFFSPFLVWAVGVCEPCNSQPCDAGLKCQEGVCQDPNKITFCPPTKTKSFEDMINTIMNYIVWIAIPLAILVVIVAGYFFLISGGDPEKVRTAKRIIFWTFIGLIIVLSAKGIAVMIKQLIGG